MMILFGCRALPYKCLDFDYCLDSTKVLRGGTVPSSNGLNGDDGLDCTTVMLVVNVLSSNGLNKYNRPNYMKVLF